MEVLGKFFTSIIILSLLTILGGFVLQQYWSWFISSTFDVKQLSLIQCIGLMSVSSLFKFKVPSKREREEQKNEEFVDVLLYNTFCILFYYLTAWGIGYIIHLFI
jgi:hypothetical protein